ncbi:MAG: ADP-ribosylglycohydrolase family protein, partial [Clostridiales bacterium]
MKKTREELSALFSPMQEFAYREDISTEDRIVGAIMGTFIGDALGVGCHWIYDFEELWKDYGFWIDDYIDPKAVNEGGPFDAIASYRYSAGVRAG